MLRFRLELRESLILRVVQTNYHPLRLRLCAAGSLTHSVDARHIQYRLNALDGSFAACSGDVDQIFHLPGHQELSLYMVEIDRQHYLDRIRLTDDAEHTQIKAVFEDTEARFPFLYHNYYSHATALALRQMDRAQQYQGIIKDTFLESKVLELLSLSVHQYATDQRPDEDRPCARQMWSNCWRRVGT